MALLGHRPDFEPGFGEKPTSGRLSAGTESVMNAPLTRAEYVAIDPLSSIRRSTLPHCTTPILRNGVVTSGTPRQRGDRIDHTFAGVRWRRSARAGSHAIRDCPFATIPVR